MGSDDFCASIGAATPAEGAVYGGLTAQQVRNMAQDLEARLAPMKEGEDCYPLQDLRQSIRSFLSQRGLTKWSVQDETTADPNGRASNGQSCGRYVFAPVDAQVIIYDGSLSGA